MYRAKFKKVPIYLKRIVVPALNTLAHNDERQHSSRTDVRYNLEDLLDLVGMDKRDLRLSNSIPNKKYLFSTSLQHTTAPQVTKVDRHTISIQLGAIFFQ